MQTYKRILKKRANKCMKHEFFFCFHVRPVATLYFSAIFTKENIFGTSFLLPLAKYPFEMGSSYKRKYLLKELFRIKRGVRGVAVGKC